MVPMRRLVRLGVFTIWLLCAFVALLPTLSSAQRPSDAVRAPQGDIRPPRPASFVPGRLIVRFVSAASAMERRDLLAAEGLSIVKHLALADLDLVAVPEGQEIMMARMLSQWPEIRYAEPDYLAYAMARPNDAYYTTMQWNLPHIGLEAAWDLTTGSPDVIVAIVDTGVDLSHPDLLGKLVPGFDAVEGDGDPSDDHGHGTHVAGIVGAASNNATGVAGVSWHSKLMPIKVLNWEGVGTHSQIAEGIRWAYQQGADIINLSLGGPVNSITLSEAVLDAYNAGCLLVAAAGNEYEEGNPPMYPAALDHVLAVGSTGDLDEHAAYSNTGDYLDVCAPGGNPSSSYDGNPRHWIYSTYWRGSGRSYYSVTGTSQACPHIAGVAALIWSVNASLSNDEVAGFITNTAVDLGTPGWDEIFGHGRVDAAAAVAAAIGGETPTPTPTGTLPTLTQTPTPSHTPTATRTPTATPTHYLHDKGWHRVAFAGLRIRDVLVHPTDARRMMVATEGHDLGAYVSEDGGDTWRQAVNGLTDRNIYQLAQEGMDPWTVYAASQSDLWRTRDGGWRWERLAIQEPPLSRLSGMAKASGQYGRLYVTAWEPCAATFTSSNGGDSWTQYQSPKLCSYTPLDSSLVIPVGNPNMIYLARAHDRPELYRSQDGGYHWDPLAAVDTGIGVNELLLHPNDSLRLYAGTFEHGVYKTQDGGARWLASSYGLPGTGLGADVTALCMDPQDSDTLFAAISGVGVYRSRDAGDYWELFGGELPLRVHRLLISPLQPRRIWAATDDGLWVYDYYPCVLPLILKRAWMGPTPTPTPTPYQPYPGPTVPSPTATLPPYPYPWPTTPGPTPTATVSPTMSATATPTALPQCTEAIRNGGFEWIDDWQQSGAWPSQYTSDEAHGGSKAMRLGILPGEPIIWSHSTAYQAFTIPAGVTSARLTFWWKRGTEESVGASRSSEVLSCPEGTSLSALSYVQDYQEVLLLDAYNYWLVENGILRRTLTKDSTWVKETIDLMPWRGRKLVLYFNGYNRDTVRSTWMYVDDVSIEVCDP